MSKPPGRDLRGIKRSESNKNKLKFKYDVAFLHFGDTLWPQLHLQNAWCSDVAWKTQDTLPSMKVW